MRTAILLAALATAAGAAHADSWSFTYTGATSATAPFPLDAISGSFTAADTNGNGVIERSEVQSLSFFEYQVAPAVDILTPMGPAGQSRLDSFSFDINSRALAFDAVAGTWDDAYVKTGDSLQYVTGIGVFTFDLSHAQLSVQGPGGVVRLQSAAAPVPEPGTWLLMALGLGALAAAGARRGAALPRRSLP